MKHGELVAKMTLEEKASLMSGKDFWQSQDISRLDIPEMFLADGPHGIRKQAVGADHLGLNESIPATCFPTAATIANSWDVELGWKIGEALGEEAAAQKVNVLLGPGINIKRNPLCGRNFEYFSEDPYLAGKMAAAYIRGIQSKGISACVKHFCVNNQEKNRMTIDTVVDERTLREIYLTAFEIAVKEGEVKTVMSSYNKLNGTYTNENLHIMLKILREEWGFDGCVVTDWGGSNNRVDGLKAGNELEMPTTAGETNEDIIKAVKEGSLDESVLDQAVDRLLNLVFTTDKALKKAGGEIEWELHHNLARQAAEESIVLLKNDDSILPLSSDTTVAVIGDFANEARYQGAGSSIVNPHKLDSLTDSLITSGLNSIGYARGFKRYGGKSVRLIKEACKLAAKADKVLLFIGLDEYTEVEGLDRKDMAIPINQIELLNALYAVNSEIIVVISSGSAVEIPWINKVKGLLHGYLSGQAGTGALLNVITGKVNPSGKLTETYPYYYEEIPSAANFPGEEASVEYREGLYIGYRYFETTEKQVLFPFGYGLSYSEFQYSDMDVNSDRVCFSIKNIGDAAGAEVAQLYVSCPSGDVFRPAKELKGFIKKFLQPGESARITFPFDDKTFRYFNIKTDKWEIEDSEYVIQIGASCRDIRLSGLVKISGSEDRTPYDKKSLPSYFSGKAADVSLEEFEHLLGKKTPEQKWDRTKKLGYNDTIAQCRYSKGLFARFAYKLIILAHFVLGKIGRRDLANLIIMSVYHMPFRGLARMTGGIVNMPMLDGIILIANGRFFQGVGKVLKEKRKMIKRKRDGK